MHEFSLAQSLMAQLTDLVEEHGKGRVTRVTMEVGPLSGVVVDSFCFGFDCLAAENEKTAGAELKIVELPVSYSCLDCGHETVEERDRPARCGRCGSEFFHASGGDELILKEVELE
ncbi:MAG: hydrogenase maturation nickel metallochaperone HypA [Thermodesulfobacteriota bacterium]